MAVNLEPLKSLPAKQPAKAQEAPAKPVERPSDKAKAAATPPPNPVAVKAPEAPKPVVNTSGQTTGTTINTAA